MNSLWNNVEAAARAMSTDTGQYIWDEDDEAMRDTDTESLIQWVDDCEARLGCDVARFRAAVLAFVSRPAFDASGLPAPIAHALAAKAARSWAYVTADGRAFYVTREQAEAMHERYGNGRVFPPEAWPC